MLAKRFKVNKKYTNVGRKLHGQVGNFFLGGFQLSPQLADLLQTNLKIRFGRCRYAAHETNQILSMIMQWWTVLNTLLLVYLQPEYTRNTLWRLLLHNNIENQHSKMHFKPQDKSMEEFWFLFFMHWGCYEVWLTLLNVGQGWWK